MIVLTSIYVHCIIPPANNIKWGDILNQLLQQLYLGQLCPYEDSRPTDRDYRQQRHRAVELESEFSSLLSPEQQKHLERLMLEWDAVNDREQSNAFAAGFHLALRLTASAFLEDPA